MRFHHLMVKIYPEIPRIAKTDISKMEFDIGPIVWYAVGDMREIARKLWPTKPAVLGDCRGAGVSPGFGSCQRKSAPSREGKRGSYGHASPSNLSRFYNMGRRALDMPLHQLLSHDFAVCSFGERTPGASHLSSRPVGQRRGHLVWGQVNARSSRTGPTMQEKLQCDL